MIHVDKDQCDVLAAVLKEEVNFSKIPNDPKPNIPDEDYELLSFYLTAICHATKGNFRGKIDGKDVKGWNFLFESFLSELEKDPTFMHTEKMKNLTVTQLKDIFSKNDEHPSEQELEERAEILRTCAQCLEKEAIPFRNQEASVKEIQAFLQKIPAYADPLNKKGNLLMFNMNNHNIWKINDPENIEACIDYHIMRGAIRTGIVSISSELKERLFQKKEVTLEEDVNIRLTVLKAINYLASLLGERSIEVGNFFWWHFRTDCRSDRQPDCNACKNKFQKKKTPVCSLSGGCVAFRDEKLRTIPETTIKTIFY